MKKYIPTILIGCVLLTLLAAPIFVHAQASTSTTPATTNAPSANSSILSSVGNATIPVIGFTIKMILYLGLLIESTLIMLAGQLVAGALGFNATILNFEPPFIIIGWQIFRDIANLGFVIGIVVIAISTILRIKGYQAKQILWKLIVAALVVNFSLLIGGMIIRPANAISCFLLSYIGPSSQTCESGIAAAAKIGDSFRFTDIISPGLGDNSFFTAITQFFGLGDGASLYVLAYMAVLLLFGLVMLLTLFALAGMLFIRYFYLAFLLMISPVVWLLWIFPQTQKYFKDWWEKFIHWVLYAPLMLIFVYIALRVLDAYSQYKDGIVHNLALHPNTFFDEAGASVNFGLLLTSLFAAALLIGGLKVAAKMGHGGTALALGAVDKGQKWAKGKMNDYKQRTWDATKRTGHRVQKAGLESKWGEGIRNTFSSIAGYNSKILKYTGLRAVASSAAVGMEVKKQESKKAISGKMDPYIQKIKDLSTEQLNSLLGSTPKGSWQQAAIAETLASRKKLNKKSFSGFRDDQKVDVMIGILQQLKDYGRKNVDVVEKSMGANIDMLRSIKNNRGPVDVRQKDNYGRLTRETKSQEFSALKKDFFSGFDSNDWKLFTSSVGGDLFGDKSPYHPVLSGNVVADVTDGGSKKSDVAEIYDEVFDQALDPHSPALQSVASRLNVKQRKEFYKQVEKRFTTHKYDNPADRGLMEEKIKNVKKSMSSRISPDTEGAKDTGSKEKKKGQ